MYRSKLELLDKALSLAGLTIGELANQLNVIPPSDLKKKKGWMGQLIELALGASAGSKPIQDFPEIGVELKTIPVDINLKPIESTYICTAQLIRTHELIWEKTHLRNKLSEILWLPIIGNKNDAFLIKTIGTAFLWQPDDNEINLLRQDWEELMEMISEGKIETISARTGQVLQLRPKAANGSALTDAIGLNGTIIQTRPRGFYLRTAFTAQILKNHYQ